jgi:hypothetical protein
MQCLAEHCSPGRKIGDDIGQGTGQRFDASRLDWVRDSWSNAMLLADHGKVDEQQALSQYANKFEHYDAGTARVGQYHGRSSGRSCLSFHTPDRAGV